MTLGALGVSLIASGLAVFVAGIVDAFGIGLPFFDGPASDVHPALAVAIGPILFSLGAASLWALSKYLRWLGRTLSSALPR